MRPGRPRPLIDDTGRPRPRSTGPGSDAVANAVIRLQHAVDGRPIGNLCSAQRGDLAGELRETGLEAGSDGRVDDAEVIDDQVGPQAGALKFVGGLECVEFGAFAPNEDETGEVATVSAQDDRLEAFDSTGLLEPRVVGH